MILKEATVGAIRYAIWQLDESIAALQRLIDHRFEVSLEGLANPTRQKERLAVHLLIEHLCQRHQPMAHHGNGEPYLVDYPQHISISHTKNYVAVAIAPFRIGIDIEYNSSRVWRIGEKFLNEQELAAIHTSPEAVKRMLLYWCSKEALYKKLPQDEPNFQQFTCSLNNDNQLTIAFQKQKYPLHYEVNDNFTFVMG